MPDEMYMVTHPNEWPHWPLLPVIRREDRQAGIILEQKPKEPIVVYHVNLFSVNRETDLTKVPTSTYPDFKAMIEDWRVD